jgi:hypothetical protein
MLVQFTDSEGRETWINPIHVKTVRTSKGMLGGVKGTEIWFDWRYDSVPITVKDSPEAVATMLNAAMPAVVAYVPEDDAAGGKGHTAVH